MYDDDIPIASNDRKMVEETNRWLVSQFNMKDMVDLAYILGVKILWNHSKRTLGLANDIHKRVLERFSMSKAKPINIHAVKNHGLS